MGLDGQRQGAQAALGDRISQDQPPGSPASPRSAWCLTSGSSFAGCNTYTSKPELYRGATSRGKNGKQAVPITERKQHGAGEGKGTPAEEGTPGAEESNAASVGIRKGQSVELLPSNNPLATIQWLESRLPKLL